IRRARECLTVHEIENVSLFEGSYAANIEAGASYFDLQLMNAAITAARNRQQCKIFAATDKDDLMHAMVAYIWDDGYAYYFLSTRKRGLAHPGAVSLLLWAGIELTHSRGLWLDFDGGLDMRSRYKFLVAFGGQIANRFEVKRSTQLYQIQRTIRRIP